MKKPVRPIIVTVFQGVAELHPDTVPKGVKVEIVDLDTLKLMGHNLDAFVSDGHASQQAINHLRLKGYL